ncbi:MAG: helix-turn-helix domain-containing protein [Brevundimonas sp.]
MTNSLHTPEYRRFVVRLVEIRKAAEVTQQELARRLGKPQSYVSKVERCERRLDPAEFDLIVRALGGDPVAAFRSVSEDR